MYDKRPAVLCFSGHDPSGGAGIQADIETLNWHHCHPCSVITALTEQNTHNVFELVVQPPEKILAQARTVLRDIAVDAIKIGLIGHVQTARAIHTVLKENPTVPVILDPVLAAGGGAPLADIDLINGIREWLLPCTTILTPNSKEARILAGNEQNLERCAASLMAQGCDYVLITGAHETSPAVTNQLFHNGKLIESTAWERLPGDYHGSGCTLAAGIAALLAQGQSLPKAVVEAQRYTWQTLQTAYKPGTGQLIPNRSLWQE